MSTIFSNSRDELRRQWLQAWKKARDGTILTPLETQLIDLIIEHPEYHTWLEEGDSCVQDEFHPEGGQSNPFLHLSMHLAIREQVSTNRPSGIANVYKKLSCRYSISDAEHTMMEALGSALWNAQRAGVTPDEREYLESLQRLSS